MSSKYGQELTDLEQSLVDHVERGTPLDLHDGGDFDEAAMRSWDDTRTIRSWVIRDILLGRLAKDADPHGIQLGGVRIGGRLELVNVTSEIAMNFRHCLLDNGIDCFNAKLGPLYLTNCLVENQVDSAFYGRQLSAPMLSLTGSTITGTGSPGALCLMESQIGRTLNLDRTTVRNDAGPAVNGESMHVGGSVLMRRSIADGWGERGTICLFDARVDGGAEFDGTTVRNNAGPAFYAELVRVKVLLYLRDGFTATGRGELGTVNLYRATLGQLDCYRATLRNDSGPALTAYALHVTGPVYLRDGFTASCAGASAVYLLEARIDGLLDCSSGTFDSTTGPGLDAAYARIDGAVYLRDGFSATGAGPWGAVSFYSTRIGSSLECMGATIRNASGPALYGEGVTVAGAALMRQGFVADGAGDLGAVLLMGADVGGPLDIRDTTLTNHSGPALRANLLKLGGPLMLDDNATLIGASPSGAMVFTDARIDSAVQFTAADVRNDRGPALQMHQARIRQSMTFDNGFRIAASGSEVTLDLSQVEVGSSFLILPGCVAHLKNTRATIDVNGFTYAGLPQGISSAQWLALLRVATPWYAAQPYQHLAAAERAAGHDSGVRRVLMAQRRDQIDKRALSGTAERLWAKLSGLTLGYGYQPWRALIGLFLVLFISGLAAGVLGGWGGLAKVRTTATAPVEACQLVDRIGFGLDAGAPLITSGARPKCETTATTWGSVLTVSGWVLKVLAWAFATLFIAGFTGAVRKT